MNVFQVQHFPFHHKIERFLVVRVGPTLFLVLSPSYPQTTSDIVWMSGSTSISGSANINGNEYSVDKGESTWTHDSGKQTTTLTVTGSGTTELSNLACYATHSEETKSANVVMRFYSKLLQPENFCLLGMVG